VARTLRDAATFVCELPKTEHGSQDWRLAVQLLIDAAEDRAPMVFAQVGVQRAMERRAERLYDPSMHGPH
jgi:hypothetical protein